MISLYIQIKFLQIKILSNKFFNQVFSSFKKKIFSYFKRKINFSIKIMIELFRIIEKTIFRFFFSKSIQPKSRYFAMNFCSISRHWKSTNKKTHWFITSRNISIKIESKIYKTKISIKQSTEISFFSFWIIEKLFRKKYDHRF